MFQVAAVVEYGPWQCAQQGALLLQQSNDQRQSELDQQKAQLDQLKVQADNRYTFNKLALVSFVLLIGLTVGTYLLVTYLSRVTPR